MHLGVSQKRQKSGDPCSDFLRTVLTCSLVVAVDVAVKIAKLQRHVPLVSCMNDRLPESSDEEHAAQ